jgi:hypothetical protein
MGCNPFHHQPKESGDAEIRNHDHHAEQERDGAEIDGGVGLLGGQDTGAQHQATAEQSCARSIDAIKGKLADGDNGVSR